MVIPPEGRRNGCVFEKRESVGEKEREGKLLVDPGMTPEQTTTGNPPKVQQNCEILRRRKGRGLVTGEEFFLRAAYTISGLNPTGLLPNGQ